MPKTIHPTGSRWFWSFLLVSSLVFPAAELAAQAAQTTSTAQTAPTAQPTPVPGPKAKVKLVEVIKSGTTLRVDPDKVKLKRREEIVVWVTNGQALKIAFKKANPFKDLVCKGRFCAALTPPDVLGVFEYTATVDGVVLDPNVEVVP